MPAKPGFVAVLVAFMVLAVAASLPQTAWADCPSGNAADAELAQAAAATAQKDESALQKFWEGLPKTDVGKSYCGQTLINYFNEAYALISPLFGFGASEAGAVATAVSAGLGGLLGTFAGEMANTVCETTINSVADSITGSISNLARVCLPLSSFGFGGWNLGVIPPRCTGGTVIEPQLSTAGPGISLVSPYGGGSWFGQ